MNFFKYFLLLSGAAAFVSCGEKNDTVELTLGESVFTVEVAKTPEERQLGLMHRKELEANRGMIFVFDYDQKLSFWMKNTHVPLDIAYISNDGTIKEIHRLKPLSETPVRSSHSVRYALEVPRGTFERLGIEPGEKLKIPEDL